MPLPKPRPSRKHPGRGDSYRLAQRDARPGAPPARLQELTRKARAAATPPSERVEGKTYPDPLTEDEQAEYDALWATWSAEALARKGAP